MEQYKRRHINNAYEYGLAAEELVRSHMHSLRYLSLHQRYKCVYGEIDLICHNRELETLVFIEVKARKKLPQRPLINGKQIERSCAAASYFLSQYPEFTANNLRFDYVIIHGNQIAMHIENAWEYQEPCYW